MYQFIQFILTEGKAQYSWPPYTNWFISAAFDIANIIYLFYTTSNLEEEANRTRIRDKIK